MEEEKKTEEEMDSTQAAITIIIGVVSLIMLIYIFAT